MTRSLEENIVKKIARVLNRNNPVPYMTGKKTVEPYDRDAADRAKNYQRTKQARPDNLTNSYEFDDSEDLQELFGLGGKAKPKPGLETYYILGHAHPQGVQGLNFKAGTKGVVKSGKAIIKTHRKIVDNMDKGRYPATGNKLKNFGGFLAARGHTPESAFEMGRRHNHEMMSGEHDDMTDETKRDLGHHYYSVPALAQHFASWTKK